MPELVSTLAVFMFLALVPVVTIRMRARIRSHEQLAADLTLLTSDLPTLAATDWHYICTTFTEDPSQRFWGFGLWQRGWCNPSLQSNELVIIRRGAASLVIPLKNIVDVTLSGYAVGRGVEPNGLVGVSFVMGGVNLTSWLRAPSQAERDHLLQLLGSEVR